MYVRISPYHRLYVHWLDPVVLLSRMLYAARIESGLKTSRFCRDVGCRKDIVKSGRLPKRDTACSVFSYLLPVRSLWMGAQSVGERFRRPTYGGKAP